MTVISLAPYQRTAEFDCEECGRHIVAFAPTKYLCAFCQNIPGWYRDPQLAAIFEPERRQ